MSDPRTFRDSELSHIYKEGGSPEPSRQIDQAILTASRRASRRERSFARRWAPSFALAATVVLAFSLLLKISEESPGELGAPLLDRIEPAEAPKSDSMRESEAVTKPAAAPETLSAPAPASPAESEEARKSVTPPAAAPASSARPASALKKEAPERVRADRLEQSFEARPESPSAVGAAQMREAPNVTPEQTPSVSPTAAERLAPPAAADAVAAPDAASGILKLRSAPERSPQAWLDDIRKLRIAGRIEEADHELAEFRKRYPEYVLPDDLR